ncbi:MAG: cell surface protein, partial [Deltaproteobacteria bacterium]|nr:cell surface protein [Deltaproteobacteria bacterium]
MKELRRSVFTAFLAVFIFVAAGPVWAGSLRFYYSTYLGGGGNDYGWGLALDGSGNAYVTGYTDSTDFPTGPAFQGAWTGSDDAFVSKLAPGGTALVYSTYLGGGGTDRGYSIAVDNTGRAYVTGRCSSTDFPTAQAFQGTFGGGNRDAFITKLGPNGTALGYSTYLGGGALDQGNEIALDGSGNVYVSGRSSSTNFPTKQAFQGTKAGGYDAFVTKLVPSGTAIAYSTYLGGGNDERGIKIAVDRSGKAYVTGRCSSTDFPTAQAFQGTFGGGNRDAFITKLGPNGT